MATDLKPHCILACEEPLMELADFIHALEMMGLGMEHDGDDDNGSAVYRLAHESADLVALIRRLLFPKPGQPGV